jgi:lipopolysaccharide transport system permease protein
VPVTFPLALVAVLILILFGTLVGALLAPLSLVAEDFTRSLSVLGTVWLIITPVVYVAKPGHWFSEVIAWNPVTTLLGAARDWLTIGSSGHAAAMPIITMGVLFGLLLAWLFFRLCLPYALERLNG